MASNLRFSVNKENVIRFSRLTGDMNPLHNDIEYARRSLYRRAIAQGMLIFGHVVLLEDVLVEGKVAIPTHMKAQFVEPVYFDQPMIYSIVSRKDCENPESLNFEVAVKRLTDGVLVQKGLIGLRYIESSMEESKETEAFYTKNNTTKMVTGQPLALQTLLIEEISPGRMEQFQFALSPAATNEFLDILCLNTEAGKGNNADRIKNRFHTPNLLAAMMLSTSVGMKVPGRYATFLDFDINFIGEAPVDGVMHFQSEVKSVSKSTRMLKKTFSIVELDKESTEFSMEGSVHAAVSNPPAEGVEMHVLKERTKDLGLKGKVALITGASRGIGETIAKLLSLQGAHVAINYYQGEHDANRVVHDIEYHGGRAIAVGADVRDEHQVQAMIKKIIEEFGTIHILVNNAVRDFKPLPFEKTNWDEFADDIDVVVKGAFNCCKAVLPIMMAQKSGKIINMGTVATENPPANQSKYVVAKSALVGLTRALSIEYAAKNIQINMVVPHFVATDLVAHIPTPYRQKMEREIPMKRAASTVDVAQAVLYLASTFANYTTGQKIMVTGGGAPYA